MYIKKIKSHDVTVMNPKLNAYFLQGQFLTSYMNSFLASTL